MRPKMRDTLYAMWRMNFSQYRGFEPFQNAYHRYNAAQANPASRVAMIAAALVVGLPLMVLLMVAVLVGLAVFLTMVMILRVATLVAAGVDVVRGLFGSGRSHDVDHRDGRENVRVIYRD